MKELKGGKSKCKSDYMSWCFTLKFYVQLDQQEVVWRQARTDLYSGEGWETLFLRI